MPKKNPEVYFDPKKLLKELSEYHYNYKDAKETGEPLPRINEYLGECFLKIATRLAYKKNFIGYSYRDEMILDAVENCISGAHSFNPEKSSYAFAYITQIAYNAFVRRIKKEATQAKVKNKALDNLEQELYTTQEHDIGTVYRNTSIEFAKENSN